MLQETPHQQRTQEGMGRGIKSNGKQLGGGEGVQGGQNLAFGVSQDRLKATFKL